MNKEFNTINRSFAKQEVGAPFYIIDRIKNDICACDAFACLDANKQLAPVLFLDKSLAEKVAKLFNDDRAVTGLSNWQFNAICSDHTSCLIATDMDEKGNLLSSLCTVDKQGNMSSNPCNIDEIRCVYNLKTTDELYAKQFCCD
ncbi:hypothetical protein [Clostridium sp.]|jgi:hypothetical protein|uniref:hypothetical protein n=1 Tax=Clostridium sp. TaxID=1506 RepID=UPI003EE864AA